jgi:hypothetical protein
LFDIEKKFGTDHTLEEDGVWIQLGENARILIARLNNPAYDKLRKRLTRPFANFRGGTIPEEDALRIFRQCMSETIILDWDGIALGGKPLPYSKANALKLLTEYKDFADFVAGQAANIQNFQDETEEARAKNSGKSSATSTAPAGT